MKKNIIVLYHGSEFIVNNPSFDYYLNDKEKRKGLLDYGDGFYCTQDKEAAKEWACRRNSPGKINKYTIDLRSLNILDLTEYSKEDNVLIWLSILLHFRYDSLSATFKNDYKKELKFLEEEYFNKISSKFNSADVIVGYRADDAYFKFPKAFIQSEISLNTLREAFEKRNLGTQIVIMSKKAFSKIKYVDSYDVDINHYFNYRARVNELDNEYHIKSINDRNKNNVITITTIMKKRGYIK